MKISFFLAILACPFLVACSAPSSPDEPESVDRNAVAESLMAMSRDWSDAVAAGNMEAVLGYWADDAVMMAPGQPPLRGKNAIEGFLASTAEIPGFEISWEPLEAHVSAGGNMAYLIERNQISMLDSTGTRVTEHNKVLTVWERQEDGSWKNVVDMWNADAMGSGPADQE